METIETYGAVWGCDISPEAVRYCRERGLKNVEQCSVDAMTFAEGAFNVITCLDVIEHTEDDVRAMNELRRVLLPGGFLIVAVPAYPFLVSAHDAALSHLRRYTPTALRILCEESGFQVQTMGFLFGLIFPAIALVRVIRRFLPVPKEFRCDTEFLPPRWMNSWLDAICRWEFRLSRYLKMPFGTTLFVVATNRQEADCP